MSSNYALRAGWLLFLAVLMTGCFHEESSENADPVPEQVQNDPNLKQPDPDPTPTDTQAPTISTTVPASDSVVSQLNSFRLTFDEAVKNADDINSYTLNGDGKGTLNIDSVIKTSDTEYELILSGLVNNGAIRIGYTNIQDAAQNKLTNLETIIHGTTTSPTQMAVPPSAARVNGLSTIEITFSKAVQFADDVANYQLIADDLGTLQIDSVIHQFDNTWQLALSGQPADGDVQIKLNNIMDLVGNTLQDGLLSYNVDGTSPSILSTVPVTGSYANDFSVITLTFSEEVDGALDISNYILEGTPGDLDIVTISSLNNVYTLNFIGSADEGSLTLSTQNITDKVGNPLNFEGLQVAVDRTSPTVTITGVTQNNWNADFTDVTLAFSEAVQFADLADSYQVKVTRAGSVVDALQVAEVVNTVDNTYQVTFTGTLEHADKVDFSTSGFYDQAGNAVNPQVKFSVWVDKQAPTFATVSPVANTSVAFLETVQLDFSEIMNAASVTDPANYVVTGTGANTLAVNSIVKKQNKQYEVTLTGDVVEGDVNIALNNITDFVGNPLTDSLSYTTVAPKAITRTTNTGMTWVNDLFVTSQGLV